MYIKTLIFSIWFGTAVLTVAAQSPIITFQTATSLTPKTYPNSTQRLWSIVDKGDSIQHVWLNEKGESLYSTTFSKANDPSVACTDVESDKLRATNLNEILTAINYTDSVQISNVVVRVLVNASGKLQAAILMEAQNDDVVAKVIPHLNRLTFRPANDKNGELIDCWGDITFPFGAALKNKKNKMGK